MPARARMTASATACTASSWPTTRSCRMLVELQELLALALDQPGTGMPVQRETISAISSSVTSSRSSRLSACFARQRFLLRSSLCFELGQSAVLQFRGSIEIVVALGHGRSRARSCSISLTQRCEPCRSPPSPPPTGPAWSLPCPVARPVPCASVSSRSLLALSFSFFSAASSISSCITRRVTSSSSVGIESISVRIMAQASSIRSIALSGRKRSLM